MTNYSDMTDAQINRLVAERLYSKQNVDMKSTAIDYVLCFWDGRNWCIAPSWASDNNAAAALDFGEWTVEITRYPDGSVGVTANSRDEYGVVDQVRAGHESSMACAITEAWLLYMDAMEAAK